MSPTIIIPVRFASSRFPGKPLHMIGNKPLIEWTWLAARRTGWPIHIATDDDEIAAVARHFGAKIIMTGECENGTERVAEAASRLGVGGAVVNWQGDSPLCPPMFAKQLVDRLAFADVATPIVRADVEIMRRIRADAQAGIAGATMAVCTTEGRALYFSKAIIPPNGPHFLHIGMYAYRAEVLKSYGRAEWEIEQSEGLEQLRWLDLEKTVDCVEFDSGPIWEVNNPGDVAIVELMLQRQHAVA